MNENDLKKRKQESPLIRYLRTTLDGLRLSVTDEDLLKLKIIDKEQAEDFLKRDLSKEEVDYVKTLLNYSQIGEVFHPWPELMEKAMENLDHLESFEFIMDALPSRQCKFVLEFPQVDGESNLKYIDRDLPDEWDPEPEGVTIPLESVSLTEFKDLLEQARFSEWQSNYSDTRGILDGMRWRMNLNFRNSEIPTLSTGGMNAYPEEYKIITNFFHTILHDELRRYIPPDAD